ncbi:unknown [Prevotella sp. CAG:5226]|nr:unknown [Prevotella sp. CAG:5226]
MAVASAGHTSLPQFVQRFDMSVCNFIGAPHTPQNFVVWSQYNISRALPAIL